MCGSGTNQCAPCKKKFVDSRLKAAASLYANLGIESTADEEQRNGRDPKVCIHKNILG